MRKAFCFAVLAFFLVVSMVSSIHAASYPPDAPLPRFQVTKVEGTCFYAGNNVVDLRFQVEQTNFEEWASYWEIRLPDSDSFSVRTWAYRYNWVIEPNRTGGPGISFAKGASLEGEMGGAHAFAVGGRWVRFQFAKWNVYTEFNPSLYLCDVYVPNESDLPVGVWSDLQFRQTSPTIPQMPVIAAVAIVAIGLVTIVIRKKH